VNPVRIGVIGLGSVFDKYGKLLVDQISGGGVEVVDLFDVDPQRQDLHSERFSLSSASSSAGTDATRCTACLRRPHDAS
jgi:predicted dehydrogenase